MSEFLASFRQGFIRLSAPGKLFVLVIILLVFALFGSLLAMVIAIPAFNYSIFELSEILSDPNEGNITVIKFFQIFQAITLFVIPGLFAAWLFGEKPAQYIRVHKAPSLVNVMLVMFSIVTAIPFLNYVTELNSRLDLPYWLDKVEEKMINMEETAAELTELFLVTKTTSDLIVNLIMIAILPAIGEELIFRGLIQRLFSQWFRNSHLAILGTAFLFSFIHFQFFGFVPRFLLGLYFGYLLLWSGTLWLPVLAHLINNGLAVLYYHFAAGNQTDTIDKIGISESSRYMLYVSIVLTVILVSVIYLREKENSSINSKLL